MVAIFPSAEWVGDLKDKLNSDEKYAQVARNWEGDLTFDIEPTGDIKERIQIYLDLWHGKCRDAHIMKSGEEKDVVFVLNAPYRVFVQILTSQLDPMQAMLTRKLIVKGSLAYMLRNIPTVLDFVRCAQEITSEHIEA